MQESQDDRLKAILHDKLSDYEAGVSQESSDAIFASLQKTRSAVTFRRMVSYSAALLSVMSLYVIYYGSRSAVDQPPLIELQSNAKSPGADKLVHSAQPPASNPPSSSPNKAKRSTESSEPQYMNTDQRGATPQPADPASLRQPVEVTSSPDPIDAGHYASTQPKEVETISQVEQPIPAPDVVKITDSTFEDQPTRSTGKIRLNVSLMPFLNFKRIIPNGSDGAYLSGFKSPSGLSADRLGMKAAFGLDYDLGGNKYLYGGVSYFRYRSTFEYNSNEVTGQVNETNTVNETIQGVALSIGGRYPLKMRPARQQYIAFGGDVQFLMGTYYPLTPKNQFMVHAGYANDFSIGQGRVIRLQPTINYSITKFHYGGLQTQPYWIGLDIAYSWGLSAGKNKLSVN